MSTTFIYHKEENVIREPVKSFLPEGIEVCYRNNSAGGGTLIHLTKENGKQYCGYSDPFSEHILIDSTDYILESQVCKKCLKFSKFHNNQK